MKVCSVLKWWFSTFSTLPRLTTRAINQICMVHPVPSLPSWRVAIRRIPLTQCWQPMRSTARESGCPCWSRKAGSQESQAQFFFFGVPGGCHRNSSRLWIPALGERRGQCLALSERFHSSISEWSTVKSGDFTLRWCLNEPRSEIKRPWKRTSRNFRKKVWFGPISPISSIMMQVENPGSSLNTSHTLVSNLWFHSPETTMLFWGLWTGEGILYFWIWVLKWKMLCTLLFEPAKAVQMQTS